MDLKQTATTWNMVTKTVTGTAATVAVLIALYSRFQPAGVAAKQHESLSMAREKVAESIRAEHATARAEDQSVELRRALEAELERIDNKIKLLNSISERRPLSADEQDELDYAKLRRAEITKRLYDK